MSYDKNIMVIPALTPSFGVERVPWMQVHQDLLNTAVPMDRAAAETDPKFQQIIPFVVVLGPPVRGEPMKILAATRLSGGGETRLHGGITLGFGGHVKWEGKTDPAQQIMEDLARELEEELGLLPDQYTQPDFHAVISDPTSEVSEVHLGLLFFVQLKPDVSINDVRSQEPDSLKTFWTTLDYLPLLSERLEMWAKLTHDYMFSLAQEQAERAQQMPMGMGG